MVFLKICWRNYSLIKSDKKNCYFIYVFACMTITCWIVGRIKNFSNKSFWENQNTFYVQQLFFFQKPCRLADNVEKYGAAREAEMSVCRMHGACWISKNTGAKAHARACASTSTHSHVHTQICNTYCFSTASVFSWNCLNFMLCLRCLSCCLLVNFAPDRFTPGYPKRLHDWRTYSIVYKRKRTRSY